MAETNNDPVPFFVGQIDLDELEIKPDDPGIVIPNERKVDDKGKPVAEALFGNHNAKMFQEAEGGSLVGRTDPGRGPTQKISVSAPLVLGDKGLSAPDMNVEQEDQEDAEDPAIAGKLPVKSPHGNGLDHAPFLFATETRLNLYATGPSLVGRSDDGRGPMQRINVEAPLILEDNTLRIGGGTGGDVVLFGQVDAPLHVRSNALLLDHDSSLMMTPDGKLSVASSPSAPIIAFRAHRNYVDQPGFPHNVRTKVILTNKAYDQGGYFDTTTSSWTPPPGLVHIDASVAFQTANLALTGNIGVAIFKNGGVVAECLNNSLSTIVNVSYDDVANGTDVYEMYATGATQGGTGTVSVYGAYPLTFFDGHMPVGGAKGDQGVQGVQGPQGIQGVQGPIGNTGPPGLTGPPGPQGVQGQTGATGSQGIPGSTGPQGLKGDQGPPGGTGPAGAQGPQGPIGGIGPTGPEGPAGPQGPVGPAGPTGPQGPAGGAVQSATAPLQITSGVLSLDLTDFARKSQQNTFAQVNYFTATDHSPWSAIVIGDTTAHGYALELSGLGTPDGSLWATTYNNQVGNQPTLWLNKSRGATKGAHVTVQQGDNLGTIHFRGSDGTDFRNAAAIIGSADQLFPAVSANCIPGSLRFFLNGPLTGNPLGFFAERMHLDQYGRLFLGNSSDRTNGIVLIPQGPTVRAAIYIGHDPTGTVVTGNDNSGGNIVTRYGPLGFQTEQGLDNVRVDHVASVARPLTLKGAVAGGHPQLGGSGGNVSLDISPPAGDSSTKIATTANLATGLAAKADLTYVQGALASLSFFDLNEIQSPVNPGVYGDDGHIPQLEVDQYGRVIQILSNRLSASARNMVNGLNITIPSGGAFPWDIFVSPGACADSTNTDIITLPDTIRKSSWPWAEQSAYNPYEPYTGSCDAVTTYANQPNTWYHVYVIKRPDNGHGDVILSPNINGPILPTGYTLFRRIGSLFVNASGQCVKTWQRGDEFLFDTPIFVLGTASFLVGSRQLFTVRAPLGLSVTAILNAIAYNNAGAVAVQVTCPDHADVAPSSTSMFTFMAATTGMYANAAGLRVRTNVSGQVGMRHDQGTNCLLYIVSTGWVDARGRDGS